MKVDITDILSIENKIVEQQVLSDLAVFKSKLGEFSITKKAPFVLHLENQDNKRVLIQGETDVTIAIPCDRCLEEVSVQIHLVIDRRYPLGNPSAGEDEDAEDTDYMTGSNLDVDRLIYDEILVNWPMKVLCREDCKGICRKCGTNLNYKTCSCDRTEPDPRMAAIQDVFNQFKEV